MLCKKKTLLSVSLSLLYFCLRTVLHLLAGEHCEMWFLDDMRPPVIWCIAFVLLYMSFLWIDYLLIDNLYRKGVFSKWFLILVIVCDIFFYINQFSMRLLTILFCVLTKTGYWSWRVYFVSGVILSYLVKLLLIVTKYLLVKKHLCKSFQRTDKLQMALACLPIVNWSNFFLRRFWYRNMENRKEIMKRDLLIFGCSIIAGIVFFLVVIYGGIFIPFILLRLLEKCIMYAMITAMCLPPFGAPMIADLLMVQLSPKKSTEEQGDEPC